MTEVGDMLHAGGVFVVVYRVLWCDLNSFISDYKV